MTTYAYARVSTEEQNLDRQLAKFDEMGIPRERVFVDKLSGKNLDRPGWADVTDLIGEGDLLVLDSLDRLGRSYDDIKDEWCRITRRIGCDVQCLDLDFMDSRKFRDFADIGRVMEDMILSVLAWKAQKERADMLQRQAEGISAAKALGKYKGGVPRKHSPEALAEAQRVLDADGKTAAAKVLGVNRATVYRMIADGRLENGAA